MMRMELITFDKQKAKQALARKYTAQRPVRKKFVESLRQKMDSRRWVDGPQTIVFNTKGELIDGQHRLLAFLNTKTVDSIVFPVMFDSPDDSYYHLDQGQKRTTADATNMSPIDAATLNAMLYGPTNNRSAVQTLIADPSVMLDLFHLVQPSMTYLCPLLPTKGSQKSFFPAPARAVLLRAHLNGIPNLPQFIEQIASGEGIMQGENSVIKYRDFIMRSNGRHKKQFNPAELYQKMQNVLWNWHHKKSMRNLTSVSEDLFPLPKHLVEWVSHNTGKQPRANAILDTEFFDFVSGS